MIYSHRGKLFIGMWYNMATIKEASDDYVRARKRHEEYGGVCRAR